MPGSFHDFKRLLIAAWLFLPLALGAANIPTGLLCDLMEHPEKTVIASSRPTFGWIYNPSAPGDGQSGYRIILSSTPALAAQGAGDVWDSGVVSNAGSINIRYAGPPLRPDTDYYWRVQTVDSAAQAGAFSAVQRFHTDAQFDPDRLRNNAIYNVSTNAWAGRYPLRFVEARPVLLTNTGPGRWFVDFGLDAFGDARVRLNGSFAGQIVQARFGEMADGFAVRSKAAGTVRFGSTQLALQDGEVVYDLRPPALPGQAVDVRAVASVVMPFRYLELTNCPGPLTANDVMQQRLQYEFNDQAATFDSSSAALNQVWALCKYSIKATSFAGVYVDGDRERKPYEADAYINQLSQYAVDREFTLARYSQEYLLAHPTWPFEWKFHSILLAWADYMQTGDAAMLVKHYDALKAKLFVERAREDGLIRGFPGASQQSGNSDLVDWPAGERDGFVLSGNSYSAINNAFYFRCLQIMSEAAGLAGNTNDAADFRARAKRVLTSYNDAFWDKAGQCYFDGEGIHHSSAHANFFPLAFGLVPATNQAAVVGFLHTRGMAPSVYGAQYLLEGLFQCGDADYALGLMTTNGARGWLNMIKIGSTITTEAWDFSYKPNMDWNHAWGAPPANIITRYVLGLRPVEAGYGKVVIQPQLGQSLTFADGTVPTIRGPVFIRAENAADGFHLRVNLPGNVTASILLPTKGAAIPSALVDGKEVSGVISNGWLRLEGIGSGPHAIIVESL